jgi:hypothetical protein
MAAVDRCWLAGVYVGYVGYVVQAHPVLLLKRKFGLHKMINVHDIFARLCPAPPAPSHARRSASPASRSPAMASGRGLTSTTRATAARGFLSTPPLAEWLAAWRRAPQMVLPPRPCSCGGHLFWTPCSVGGPYTCTRCHAPPFPDRVARHLELVIAEGQPRIKVLARQSSSGLQCGHDDGQKARFRPTERPTPVDDRA